MGRPQQGHLVYLVAEDMTDKEAIALCEQLLPLPSYNQVYTYHRSLGKTIEGSVDSVDRDQTAKKKNK